VRRDIGKSAFRAGLLNDAPDHFRAESAAGDSVRLVDRPKDGSDRNTSRETKDWEQMRSTIDRFLGSIPETLADEVS
jgi:hypothetical protein